MLVYSELGESGLDWRASNFSARKSNVSRRICWFSESQALNLPIKRWMIASSSTDICDGKITKITKRKASG